MPQLLFVEQAAEQVAAMYLQRQYCRRRFGRGRRSDEVESTVVKAHRSSPDVLTESPYL